VAQATREGMGLVGSLDQYLPAAAPRASRASSGSCAQCDARQLQQQHSKHCVAWVRIKEYEVGCKFQDESGILDSVCGGDSAALR
jgi:hypothetical protein